MGKKLDFLQANKTGTELEIFIHDRLRREGYIFVPNTRFIASKVLNQPIYTRQFKLGKSIYETLWRCDFILYHPKKHPASVDEKYPYLVLNIKKQSTYNTIVIVDGDGYKPGALRWLKQEVGGNLNSVYSMSEFTAFVNKQKI